MKRLALSLSICLMAIGSVANGQVEGTFTNSIQGNFATFGGLGALGNSDEDFADCSGFLDADPANHIAEINSISWNVDIDPQGGSWYSEVTLGIEVDGVQLAAGDFAGSISGDGAIDADADGDGIQFLPNDGFANNGGTINSTGTFTFDTPLSFTDVDFEFFETFDDDGIFRDAFIAGEISINFTHRSVPEPTSAILLAGLGLGLIRRRR